VAAAAPKPRPLQLDQLAAAYRLAAERSGAIAWDIAAEQVMFWRAFGTCPHDCMAMLG
jgi:hypothetical protein